MPLMNNAKAIEIIRTLSDDYSRKIVLATITKPLTIDAISEEHDIPISTCYRRIHDLEEKGIIRSEPIITDDGKRAYLYRSTFKRATISFASDEFAVKVKPNGT